MKAGKQGSPTLETRLTDILGPCAEHWRFLWDDLDRAIPEIAPEWKSLKYEFGSYCIVRSKKRALLYLIPGHLTFEVAIVLGEKAASLAARESALTNRKKLIIEAPRCAAGRTVRFHVSSQADVLAAKRLVEIKVATNP